MGKTEGAGAGGGKKRRYIQYKGSSCLAQDATIKNTRLDPRAFSLSAADASPSNLRDRFLPGLVRRKPREPCLESCTRCFNLMRFCLGCSASIFQVLVRQCMKLPHDASGARSHPMLQQAPWVLSTIELVAVLLTYFLGISRSLLVHEPTNNYHFSWRCSPEDIVGLAIVRSILLSVTYAWGVHNQQR